MIISIIAKSKCKKCTNCKNALSEYEKSLLVIFITALKYRDPQTIELGMEILQQLNPKMSDRESRNFTLMNLLLLGVDPDWDKNTLIRTAVLQYDHMAFQIGIAPGDDIITSDRPIIEYPSDEKDGRYKGVVFPLTARLVLFMYPKESVCESGLNCFFELNKEQIHDVQYNTSIFARRWIYSRYPLTDDLLETIRNARSVFLSTGRTMFEK